MPSSSKVPLTCLSCGHTWRGKALEDRKVEARCPTCGVRQVVLGDIPPPMDAKVQPSSQGLIPDEDLRDLTASPIEIDHTMILGQVDVPDHKRKDKPKVYSKAQIAQMEKASKQSMIQMAGMGYVGLIMIINWIGNWSLPPPTTEEINQFAESWLNVTRTQRTFHSTVERIPWIGMFVLHAWFFIKRRRFFKPPMTEESKYLADTETEPEPEVVNSVTGESPFSRVFEEMNK